MSETLKERIHRVANEDREMGKITAFASDIVDIFKSEVCEMTKTEFSIAALTDDGYSVEIRKIKGGYMVVCRKYSEEDHESFSARGETVSLAIYNASEKWAYGYE